MAQKQELIKQIVRFGNSAGVLLPREWLNGKARIELVEKPINIKQDVLKIIEPYLTEIMGIYLIGSYAREEETSESDVDILIITNKLDKKIVRGKYNITMVSEGGLQRTLKNTAFPIIPMLLEAKTIINQPILKGYVSRAKLTKNNSKIIIELARSALNVQKSFLNLDGEMKTEVEDAVAYSIVLQIRSMYLIDCLKSNKKQSTKQLKGLISKVSGSLNAYEGYLRVKNNKKGKNNLPLEEAEKLISYLEKQIEKEEKWLKKRKN